MSVKRIFTVFFASLAGFVTPSSWAAGDYSFNHPGAIELNRAHLVTRGSAHVKIALISTGVNYRLPDIYRAIQINVNETGSGREQDGIDNDQNGYADDLVGVDTFLQNNDPFEPSTIGLGSFIAQLLAAPDFGVAPDVRIIPIKAFSKTGSSHFKAIAQAFKYALDRGADIILNIATTQSHSDLLCRALANAKKRGALVVAAAPEVDAAHFPYDCPTDQKELLVVTASDARGGLASFSPYHHEMIDIAAPGLRILGRDAQGKTVRRSGVSVAAAVVAGVAGLVKSRYPHYSVEQLKRAVMWGADFQNQLKGKVKSNGRVNAYRALTVEVQ